MNEEPIKIYYDQYKIDICKIEINHICLLKRALFELDKNNSQCRRIILIIKDKTIYIYHNTISGRKTAKDEELDKPPIIRSENQMYIYLYYRILCLYHNCPIKKNIVEYENESYYLNNKYCEIFDDLIKKNY
jgi:hypothetical protein